MDFVVHLELVKNVFHGSSCVVRVAFIVNLEEAFESFYIATMVRLLVVNILGGSIGEKRRNYVR
jgi:hypothetical protein